MSNTRATTTSPDFDVVVFGATSFVGKILCRYLFDQFGTNGELRWAAAGRSRSRLDSLRATLGDAADKLELLIADAADECALRQMCERTRVVISTVGPYALHGEPLVRVCTDTGIDYCDITGEVQWVRRMIDRYERRAAESGARIVHCCGFDSIPSDMGVFFLQRHARARFGEPCVDVSMRVKAMRGGFSGGTIASLSNAIGEIGADPALRKELANPYCLCPPDHPFTARQRQVRFAAYDPDFESWTAPFVMAAVNTRIVHRSNALSGTAYGDAFRYDESVLTGRGWRGRAAATAVAAGLAGFGLLAATRPTRRFLERLAPAPGSGPDAEARARGFFDLRFAGATASGQQLLTKVTGDMDPGYGSTSKMLGQAGACLALDVGKGDKPGGFWTPATLFGERLLDRLQAHAGLRFELLDVEAQRNEGLQ